MIDFVQLQQVMKEQLTQDRSIRIVEVSGPTIDAAVTEAAVMLNSPIKRIEYEITERGFSGFLGTGKKEWKIRAYEQVVIKKDINQLILDDVAEEAAAVIIEDKNGDVFVHLDEDGVNLKVVAPVGNGRKVTVADAMEALNAKNVTDIDEKLVQVVVKEAKGIYIMVGTFNRKYSNDSMVQVNITDQDMKAFITVIPPGPGGVDISAETIIRVLKDNRVVYGIKEEFLQTFVDRPTYKIPVLVAEGSEPVNGKNAYIQYNFRVEQGKKQLKANSDGKVDFRESNTIQNVVKDQPLGKKIPPEEGVMGRTVVGGYLPAKNGSDIEFPLGENVRVADDRMTIVSNIAGQVILAGGKITVDPVYVVQGNVNLKTGNITFLGTVIVTGNVEDGFSIKAQSNIEVKGTVEKADLEAEGDIVVLKGISGKNTGTVRAGKSVYARFIDNAVIEAGNMVIASDGIINSRVDAHKRIVCQGKRARIVGGRYRASEEINAKTIGSAASGTETICEVGIDPKKKKQLDDLVAKRIIIEKELEEAKLNFQTLNNILQQRKSLPPEKEAQMKEIMASQKVLIDDFKQLNEEIDHIQQLLNEFKTRGRVSASEKIYPGVKVVIKDVIEEVKNEYKATTFILEDNLIRVVKYEEPDPEAKKGPDGYME
jgi:uncharacterized protein (DUF342 family)